MTSANDEDDEHEDHGNDEDKYIQKALVAIRIVTCL